MIPTFKRVIRVAQNHDQIMIDDAENKCVKFSCTRKVMPVTTSLRVSNN